MTRSQWKLLALLALFATPVLAAWLSYTFWQPQRHSNYGELLPPTPLQLPALTDPVGHTRSWADLRGKWVLLVVKTVGCEASCLRAAYLARQVRLAQGRERERVEQVLLGPQANMEWPFAEAAYRGILPQASGALARGGLFLVDPLGNLMLRFPDTPDGGKMIHDLRRLLQASQIG